LKGDFCGGKAHKGMSEMANNIWLRSGEKIISIFESDETIQNYSFSIVGHSLGAGVACLLQIKCYKEDLFGPDRVVKCYGFAPPPTFCYDEQHHDSSIQRAIDNTICYVHDNDCVPLLSVMSVRRFSVLMDTVDNHTEHLWFYNRFLMFWGWKDIPTIIIDDVTGVEKEKVSTMKCCDGASKLMIPAKIIVWMKKDVITGTYTATGCSPQSVADLNIFFW
jgi:Lipase (class 3)